MNSLDRHFFLIDRDNLDLVRTHLYGYAVEEDGIIEQVNLGNHTGPFSGCGAFVHITVSASTITIDQDDAGSFGLYYYEGENGYFAVSNSFYRLLDCVKRHGRLTFDVDYANQLMALDLSSHTYSETPVKEIRLLDRCVRVVIDKEKRICSLLPGSVTDGLEWVGTKRGMEILDSWYEKWTRIIRGVARQTKNITLNLSGGFDSRVTFMLALKSGIDLNSIRIFSFKDGNPVHEEDFQIASRIAERFGCQLDSGQIKTRHVPFSLDDMLEISFNTKMGFHKKMDVTPFRLAENWYQIPGIGGGLIRSLWDYKIADFIAQCQRKALRYPNGQARAVADSIDRVLRHAASVVEKKYGISPDSTDVPRLIYRETRCRHHFGKAVVKDMLSGIYCLSPLMDPLLYRLKSNDPKCGDKNLLLAVIYQRYCSELLEFPIQGGRGFAQDTLAFAKELASHFPRKVSSKQDDGKFSIVAVSHSAPVSNEPKGGLAESDFDDYLMRVALTEDCKKSICRYLPEEVYKVAVSGMNKTGFVPAKEWHALVALARVAEAVQESTSRSVNRTILDDFLNRERVVWLGTEKLPHETWRKVSSGQKVEVEGLLHVDGFTAALPRHVLLRVNFVGDKGHLVKSGVMNNNETYGDWMYLPMNSADVEFAKSIEVPDGAVGVRVGISRFCNTLRISLSQYRVSVDVLARNVGLLG